MKPTLYHPKRHPLKVNPPLHKEQGTELADSKFTLFSQLTIIVTPPQNPKNANGKVVPPNSPVSSP